MTSALDIYQKQRAILEFLCCENDIMGNIHKALEKVYGYAAVDCSTVSQLASRLHGERGLANIQDTPPVADPTLHLILTVCRELTT